MKFGTSTMVLFISTAFALSSAPRAQAQEGAMRTVKVSKAASERGRQAFLVCGACHGEKAAGKPGLGPALSSRSFMAAVSDRYLFETIKTGRPGTTMVPWGASMKDEQINDIIAFLRTVQSVSALALNNSPLKGVRSNGEKLYQDICASCHGVTGKGYLETQNGSAIANAAFLKVASNGFLRQLIKYGKSSTKMRGFEYKSPTAIANLTDQEIDDIITYLRSFDQ